METLQIQQENGVAWVWFDREASLNSLDETAINELSQAFTTLNHDDTVRVIVLAGKGRSFCAGFDIKWFATLTPDQFGGAMEKIASAFALVENSPKPVIGAVQGNAAGAGIILATYCDFILAAENAKFTAPEVKLSIFPGLNLIPRLERMVGLQNAKRILFTGDPLIAAEAHRIGMVEKVVSADALYSEAQALADKLAANPPIVTQAIKQAFAKHTRPDFASWEQEQGILCWSQPEREQMMQAFLSKSK